ncbi:tumor necrosis factor receptor superfamily member 11A [Oryzias melastigma]|uniref:Tumor necrosis factor receptor superfamily member 5 n=1 Tax=Oryzias melastigma TaxID=30732 RepID=A0A3B3C6B2_ORYME|nr:tumor necrosis factor receptor superfamily member 11A [Oryzias melastigma]
MGKNLPARWRLPALIAWLILLCAQDALAKTLQCKENQYLKGSKCCDKCRPGYRVFSHCTESDSQRTECVKCNHGEYQPDWTEDMHCFQQKFCDPGKGFMVNKENPEAEEPCRCRPNLQCYHINCEFCEKLPTCDPGSGLEDDPGSTNGRKICAPCRAGFFSADRNSEQCKEWTDCKADGRSETEPGSSRTDAVCGPPDPRPTPPWVLVSVLSVLIVLCLLLLRLFCYKDKLKLLSINLRSCVQNLKRTRIQQETLAPLYHSAPAGGGIPGDPRCSPCQETKLVCQAPHSPEDEPFCTLPSSSLSANTCLLSPEESAEKGGLEEKTAAETQSQGSGEPEEVSEEDFTSVSPLLAGSCVCVIPVCEPLEVGENEDCSQAVSPGMTGTCSCGALEDGSEDRSKRAKEKANGGQEKTTSETNGVPLTSSGVPLSSPAERCLPVSQAQVVVEQSSPIKTEELYTQTSLHSTSKGNSTTSTVTLTSASVGDLYLEKPQDSSSAEQSLGPSWGNSREKKFPLGDSELDCSPESLHSQLAEPTPTSGLVSGNNNTTFISSGQVMNFSGDVIVVCVSQTSHDTDKEKEGDTIGSPVQEESSQTAQFIQSRCRSQGNNITHNTLQGQTMPVMQGK